MARRYAPGRKPTQADVARAADVSQALVSHVLNDSSTISVPEGTRRRILAAVEDLGYVTNGMARSLRTRKTYAIAGVIPDITNPFYPAFEKGIQDVAESRGYDLLVYNTGGVADKERRCLRSLQQGRVDGVVAVFFHTRATDLAPLLERGISIVRLEATEDGAKGRDLPLDSLYVDNVAAARAAVDHLLARGHRRIGLLAGERGPGQPRIRGYLRALEERGIPSEDGLILRDEFSQDGGYRAMRRLLKLSPRPTAVFATNDVMAMGALVAIREAGLRIPEDVALAGFDDTPTTELVTPPVTTVTQFQEKLGRRAAEMLFERLEGKAPDHGRYEEMPHELIVRAST